jgi:hypothetical protein
MDLPFSSKFEEFHKLLASNIPIEVFAELASNFPEFADERDVYDPVVVSVKLSGGLGSATGAMDIAVPTSDPDWYKVLCDALSKTLSLSPSKAAKMQVCTVTGQCVEGFSHTQLEHAGRLDVKVDDCLVRAPKMPNPPAELSINKLRDISDWTSGLCDELCGVVANKLSGSSLNDLDTMLARNGPVHEAIQAEVEAHAAEQYSWPEFVRVYSMDAVPANDASQVSKNVSNVLLKSLRVGMSANEGKIRHHIRIQKTKETGHPDDAPLFSQPEDLEAPKGDLYRHDREMYYELAEEAFRAPAVIPQVTEIIFRRRRDPNKGKDKPASISHHYYYGNRHHHSHHPYHRYMRHNFYPRWGIYPSFYLYEKADDPEKEKYAGDPKETLKKFHIYAGRHPPPMPDSKSKMFSPVEAGMMPPLIRISTFAKDMKEAPPLVPISSLIKNKRIDSSPPAPLFIEGDNGRPVSYKTSTLTASLFASVEDFL